jgi:hypothetical protein
VASRNFAPLSKKAANSLLKPAGTISTCRTPVHGRTAR